jgi:hypothetical protein
MIEDNKIRVTVEVGGWQIGDEGQNPEKYTFDTSMDLDITEWGYLLKKVLYCVGFHKDNIDELFGDDEDE